jgi:asparagine N-glycosylation enzyme membrane subunit Stt3
MIAVAGLGAAATAVLGVSHLSWWSLAIVVFVAGAVLAAVTYAITEEEEEKHRILALWTSTGLCAALLIGIGIYARIGPSPARTANVVANKMVTLSAEAGVSATKEPSAIDPSTGQPYVFSPGSVNTATCYTMVGRSVWLYFHFGLSNNGWAPFSDFHYQNGFSGQLPSHC